MSKKRAEHESFTDEELHVVEALFRGATTQGSNQVVRSKPFQTAYRKVLWMRERERVERTG